FALPVVPESEFLSLPQRVFSSKEDKEALCENKTRRVHAHFSGRGNDRLAQNFEAAVLLQRERKVNFFAGEILFVESANSVERCASHEKKRSHAEPGREVNGAERVEEKSCPKRQMTVHCQPCASS